MNTISILGSGWLGLPLTQHFLRMGYAVNASTTSEARVEELQSIGAIPHIVNIDSLDAGVERFLQADILIVNIPSKNIESFRSLVSWIKDSRVQNVLFVSSTSVYENVSQVITEADTEFYSVSPLLEIEEGFQRCNEFNTTVVRFGGLIGPGRHPGKFFSYGKIIQNPNSPVNLIHLDDCIGIIEKIVQQNVWDDTFNCCADTHTTKREFYTQAVSQAGGSQLKFGEPDARPGKIISNEKIKQILNYAFKHPDLMKIRFTKEPQ